MLARLKITVQYFFTFTCSCILRVYCSVIIPSVFTALCDPPCHNGGTCSSANTCQCSDGWHGPTCDIGKPIALLSSSFLEITHVYTHTNLPSIYHMQTHTHTYTDRHSFSYARKFINSGNFFVLFGVNCLSTIYMQPSVSLSVVMEVCAYLLECVSVLVPGEATYVT